MLVENILFPLDLIQESVKRRGLKMKSYGVQTNNSEVARGAGRKLFEAIKDAVVHI